MIVKIEKARLAFPAIFAPKAINAGDKPKFGASFLMEKNSPAVAAIEAVMKQVAQDKWGAKAEANLKSLKAGGKVCLRDGDEKAQYDGYEGMMFVSASNTVAPIVIDKDKSPLGEASGRPYAGCYVRCSIDVWAQDNNFGKRINATLRGVQFLADGDAFSGSAPATADEFDDLSTDEDDLM
jgi:hypothetical protein